VRAQRVCKLPECEKPAKRDFCSDNHRKLYSKRKQKEEAKQRAPISLALIELGEEQKGREREEAWLARNRLTGASRECHCNGSGIYEHDADGAPVCVKCGGSVAAAAPAERWKLLAGVIEVMRAEPYSADRSLAEEWAGVQAPPSSLADRRRGMLVPDWEES
jgi:hypothetical protein